MRSTFTNTKSDQDFMNTIIKTLQKPITESKQINEKLTPEEEDEVNYGWDTERPEHIQNTIDKVFKGKSRIEYPLEITDSVPHPDVEEHLNKNGYAITDYIGGKAKDKYNRETNIGKALVKTKAPDQVKAAYDNDPTRQQQGKKLKVVISHRPGDVAGMTSGHQSWVEQSCMNFHTGAYRGFLPHEVQNGTHVAYLTDEDDKDLDRPVARIAVKPFHNDNGHTIFRPEDKVYGNSNSSFTTSVHNWFDKHYPAEPNEFYEKNKHVYDDTGSTYETLSPEDAIHRIKTGRKIDKPIPRETVNHIANHLLNNPDDMGGFAREGHKVAFDRNQVNALYKMATLHGKEGMHVRFASRSGDVLNKENLHHALENGYGDNIAILKHRYLPQEFIDTVPTSSYEYIHPANIKPHHIDKALTSYENNESGSSYPVHSLLDRFNKDQLKRYADVSIKKEDNHGIKNVMKHSQYDSDVDDHLKNAIKNIPDNYFKKPFMLNAYVQNHKNPTAEHVSLASSVTALNSIMENTKDKLTHNVSLQKAMRLKDEGKGGQIILGKNSEDKIDDNLIPEIYNKHGYFDTGTAMSHKIHEKLLNHGEKEIDDLTEKHENSEDPDEQANLEEDINKHFYHHGDMLENRLSDMERDYRNDIPVDMHDMDRMRDHIDHAMEHPHYDDFTHDEADSTERDLRKEIHGRDYY